MAWSECIQDITVVLRALIGVFNHQLDRCSCRLALVHAGQDFHRVGLIPLGCIFVQTGTPLIKPLLDHGSFKRHAGRAAVNCSTQGGSVALAPSGEAVEVSKAVDRHGRLPFVLWV